jgi:arginase
VLALGQQIRERGLIETAQQAVGHFAGRRFWVHLDADVLDPRWMPAVDSPDPGGMSPEELSTILNIALASTDCIGIELAIYDPTLDLTGEGALLLVHLLQEALTPSPSEE